MDREIERNSSSDLEDHRSTSMEKGVETRVGKGLGASSSRSPRTPRLGLNLGTNITPCI